MNFYKKNEGDSVWWVEPGDELDQFLFSFDKKTIFNLYADYPHKLTNKQKAVFDKENPFWKDFFEGNLKPIGE